MPITYPSVTDDGQGPVVWDWDIYWNEKVIKQTTQKVGKVRKKMLMDLIILIKIRRLEWFCLGRSIIIKLII